MVEWTAEGAVIDGRKVIIVRQWGYFYGQYASLEEIAAAGVDLAELEIKG